MSVAADSSPGTESALPHRRRVLLIGIDGLRLDILEQTPTPHIDRIVSDGRMATSLIPEGTPTVSGPMWTTVLTGAWAPDHGVMDNATPAPPGRAPDVLTRILDEDPSASVFAATAWRPLTVVARCGPVVDPRRVPCFAPEPGAPADLRTAEYAIARFDDHDDDLRAAFIHLGDVDEAGHAHGVGAEYIDALLAVDGLVGRILDALSRRPDADEWTVLATTDHGHVDAGGHGGRSDEERLVWIGASDADLVSRLRTSSDIAPLMLELAAPRAS